MVVTIFLKMGYDSHFRHLAIEVGGPKRLYAMVSVYSAGFLALFALPVFFLTDVSNRWVAPTVCGNYLKPGNLLITYGKFVFTEKVKIWKILE